RDECRAGHQETAPTRQRAGSSHARRRTREGAKEIRIGQPARCLRHCMAALSAEDERWRSLCERAGNEQDLEKRIELVREINRTLIEWLLQEKDRLNLIPSHRSSTLRPDK